VARGGGEAVPPHLAPDSRRRSRGGCSSSGAAGLVLRGRGPRRGAAPPALSRQKE